MHDRFRRLILVLLGIVLPATVQAQQAPRLGYVYPPCVTPGTTVDVRLGGYDFTPDTQFFALDDRIQLEVVSPPSEMLYLPPPYWFGPKASNKAFSVPREVTAKITIPDDYPMGVIHLQAANANGATARAKLLVVDDVNIVLESRESFGRPTTNVLNPQDLSALPVTVCGCLQKKEEIDIYRFSVDKDGLVNCRILADQCGFPVHAVVSVMDSSGNEIADQADTLGTGLAFAFEAEAGESYTLSLRDLDYRGDRSMVYRMMLEQGPLALIAMPSVGQRGKTEAVTFVGYGVASGKAQLESTTTEVQFPTGQDQANFEYRLETPYGRSRPISFPLSDVSQAVVVDSSDNVPHLSASAGMTVLMKTPRREFVVELAEGQHYTIDVTAQKIGSPLDVAVEVRDPDDKVVAAQDDVANSTDASLSFQAKVTGDFRVVVQDLSGQSGKLNSICHVAFRSISPSIEIQIPEFVESLIGDEPVEINPKRRSKNGQRGVLPIELLRHGGFDGEVTIALDGLPDGIHVPTEILITGKVNYVDVPIWCDANASSLAAFVTVNASTKSDEATLTHQSRTLLAPVMKPRAVVRPKYPDAGRTVHRGATYLAPVVIERLEEYEGDVELQMAAHPDRVRQGISGQDMLVPVGTTEIDYPLFIPEWVQTDRTSRIILNTMVKIPDGLGKLRHLVNRMDRRITMNVEGALLKMTPTHTEFSLGPDQSINVQLEILRNSKFQGPVEISIDPDSVQSRWFAAESVIVADNESLATIKVTGLPAIKSLLNRGDAVQQLGIQAIGHIGKDSIVKSAADIEIILE